MCAQASSPQHPLCRREESQSHPGAGQIPQSKPGVERLPFQRTYCPLLSGIDWKSRDCNHILDDKHNCHNVPDSYVPMLTAWTCFTMDPVFENSVIRNHTDTYGESTGVSVRGQGWETLGL